MHLRRMIFGSALALASFGLAAPAQADLVTNGSFSTVTGGSPTAFLGDGTVALTGWALGTEHTGASNEIVFANGADVATRSDGVKFGLWGAPPASPDGGNFVAFDGDTTANRSLNQTITGLTVGQDYKVTFNWAAAQYQRIDVPGGFNGATTNSWQVSLGAQTFTTAVVSIPSHGFSGWLTKSFTFTATAGTEVLSFLAIGSPVGLPPVALLDGVTLNAVPEPGTWSLMIVGVGSLGFVRAVRRRKAAKA